MKILLIGGTGAIGRPLSAYLDSPENQVYVTSRREINNISHLKYITGDAHNDIFLNSILADKWDCIVDFMVYTTEEFKNRIERLLLSTKQYIYLSSARVYANSDKPIVEASPRLLDVCMDKCYLSTDEYAIKKARQEDLLVNSAYDNWTIVRPYITYNSNRFQLGVLEKEEWLYLALNAKAIVFSNDIGKHITTMTYGNDVAYVIKELIGNKKALKEGYLVTGNGNCSMTWNGILEIYRNKLLQHGVDSRIIMKEKSYRLDDVNSKYQVIYDRYFDRIFDNTKVLNTIGNFNFTSIKDGVSSCLDVFLENQSFRSIPMVNLIRSLKETDVNLKLKDIKGIKNKIFYSLNR